MLLPPSRQRNTSNHVGVPRHLDEILKEIFHGNIPYYRSQFPPHYACEEELWRIGAPTRDRPSARSASRGRRTAWRRWLASTAMPSASTRSPPSRTTPATRG